MEPDLLTVTYPGTPGRKRNLPPRAEIADGAYTGCKIWNLGFTSFKKCFVKMPTSPDNFCSGASGWDTRPTIPN